MEEDAFNPDYVEVDRVLEVSYCEDKDTGEVKSFACCFVVGFYLSSWIRMDLFLTQIWYAL